MPTIRQMYGGLYNLYKTSYNGGQLFRQTATKKQNFSANQLNTINTNYRELMQNYNQTKNTFDGEFSDAMTNLKNSAREVKNLDLSDENSVKTVENFLNDYNDAINFFSENSSVSKKVGRLATNFADTTYFAKNYSEIGIEVAKDGTMKIDAEKFSASTEKNPQKVSRTLNSLASRAESKISIANLQKNLFPTAQNMLGSDFYGGRGILQNMSRNSIGGLLNLFF